MKRERFEAIDFRRLVSAMLSALGVMGTATASFAASVTVNTTGGGSPSGCGLEEAVLTLNAGKGIGNGCTFVAGAGTNTVFLPAGAATYTLTNRLAPTVDMVIAGNGMSQTTLQAGSGFSASSLVRVQTTAPSPSPTGLRFTLQNLTLRRTTSSPPSNKTGIEVTGFWDPNNPDAGPVVILLNSRVTNFDRSAIRTDQGGIVMDGAIIENNSSPDNGGGILMQNPGGSNRGILCDRSLIYNNSTTWSGGGIYFVGGTSHIRSTTIAGNDAYSGGGIFADVPADIAYFQVMLSTIAENGAFSGGGIYSNYSIGDSRFTVSRAIVANNSGAAGPDLDGYVDDEGTIWSWSDELDQASHRENILITDPMLGPFMDLGGNGIRAYPLLAGSPAIDFTNDGGFTTTDQRGFPIFQDSPGGNPAPFLNDAGAYEQGPWQTELLAVAAKSSDAHTVVNMGSGKGTFLASNDVNDYVTYRLPVFETGTYEVKLQLQKTSMSGKARLQWANSPTPVAPDTWTNIGSEQDFYGASTSIVERNLTSTLVLPSTGQKYLRFIVTGKNSSSGSRNLRVDYVKLTRLGPPPP